MTSSVTSQPFNTNWMTLMMEPAPNATKYKEIIEKAFVASQTQDNFVKRHIEPAGYGSLAWVIAFFDTISFTGKALTESFISLIELDYEEAFQALKTNTFDAYYSAKQLLLLPFIIFAGIFLPDEVYGQMHYPGQPLEQDIEQIRAELRQELEPQIRQQVEEELRSQQSNTQPPSREQVDLEVRQQLEQEIEARVQLEYQTNNPLNEQLQQAQQEAAQLHQVNADLLQNQLPGVSEDLQQEIFELRQARDEHADCNNVRAQAVADAREIAEQNVAYQIAQASDQARNLLEPQIEQANLRITDLEGQINLNTDAAQELNSLRTLQAWTPRVIAVVEWAILPENRLAHIQLRAIFNNLTDMSQEGWDGVQFKTNPVLNGCPFDQIEIDHPMAAE